MKKLNEIMNMFDIEWKVENYGNGHINDTYLSTDSDYILQRINTNIFTNPENLMENIENVTAFLKDKIKENGGDAERETLTVIKTIDGKNFYECEDGCFRLYKFVSDTITIEKAESALDLYRAGKGFGKFQAMLDDFDATKLHETIVDFHNTPKRVEALKQAIKDNKANRVDLVKDEIDFVLSREEMAKKVAGEIASGLIPLRVTHNDTKINNILFDAKTREAACVIDLDTVMPGSALYDFGDALRVGASNAAEDETNLDLVSFNEEYFAYFAKGFLEETASLLTQREIELLAFSAKLLTFECGVRFLTDYLNGDTYFKIHREHHNLDRARNQFKLVWDIEQKEEMLNKIVEDIKKEL